MSDKEKEEREEKKWRGRSALLARVRMSDEEKEEREEKKWRGRGALLG